MKKSKFRFAALALSCLFLAGCNTASNTPGTNESDSGNNNGGSTSDNTNGNTDSGDKNDNTSTVSAENVSKIAVKTNPTKMSYRVGDTFDPTGGVLTVTYKDKSTAELSLTDSRVTITTLNTKTKNASASVKITFGGKSCSLKGIVVTAKTYVYTYQTNGGSEVSPTEPEEKAPATKPADPTKAGYDFDGWYTDAELTLAYDWENTNVSGNLTLYAKWLTTGATIYSVTFEYEYYGAVPESRIQKVESGKAATKISKDPTRMGYVFSGWVKDDGTAYDFTSLVTANVTLKAKWTRSTTEYTGSQTYKFEAEDIDFTGITGKGLSGTTTEEGAIVYMPGYNASGDRFVSYMYKKGNTLTFQIISDIATTVTLKASMSQELENYEYDSSNYLIQVNKVSVSYPKLSFQNVPARSGDNTPPQTFAEYTLGQVELKAGNNVITFMTNNSDAIDGTTMEAHAPLLDYIALTGTNFVAQWDNVKGLPKANY